VRCIGPSRFTAVADAAGVHLAYVYFADEPGEA
jgi:hypothetical protein